ncbi:MAG: GntR family transcriptional regulator [Candidatus Onthomonas sp.]
MERRQPIRPRAEAIELIECYIRRQDLAPHGKLPGEREMCEMWDLNRTTLRNAIKRLIEEGKLYSLKGSGTYVARPKLERNLQDAKSTTESVRGAGHMLRSRVLDVQVIEANKYISRKLQVPLGHKIFYLRRLRIMDNAPYMIDNNYIDLECCPGIEEYDFNDESLYRVLSYQGAYPTKGQESVGITYATEDEAKYLQVEEGGYLFFLTGVTCNPEGRPIEFFKSVARADKVRFSSVLRRRGSESERSKTE